MALLPILHYPDERLHLKAKLVTTFDTKLKELVSDMTETMYQNEGIGLAASQVNVQLRLFIMDLAPKEETRQLQVYINPVITEQSGCIAGEEGCLSVPGIFEKISRAETIKLDYQDLEGHKYSIECDGLMAICIQHEIDHLDGKVFVDYLSNLKQNFIKKKMKKMFSSK